MPTKLKIMLTVSRMRTRNDDSYIIAVNQWNAKAGVTRYQQTLATVQIIHAPDRQTVVGYAEKWFGITGRMYLP